MRRARRSFWILLAVAVLSAGLLSASLGSGPSPLAGTTVAGSGIALIASIALAARVMVAVERARRRASRIATTTEVDHDR